MLRIHEGAQWEIQKVAYALLEIAKDIWPIAIESLIENLNITEQKENQWLIQKQE